MRRLFLALVAPLMLAACSSGGGTSDGGSGIAGFSSGSTGLVITAVLSSNTFSSDTLNSDCSIPPDDVIDQIISTDTGTVTITVRDTSTVTTNANKGVIFSSYTVSYTPVSAGAPSLTTRSHGESIPIFLGAGGEASATATVILVELDTTKPEFNSKNFSGGIFTYSITVTLRGSRTDTGQAVSVSAKTSMEIGDFCDAA